MSYGWVHFSQAPMSIVGRRPGAVDAQRDAMYTGTPSIHPTWSPLRDVGSPRLPRLPQYMLSSEALRDHEILVPYLPLWFSATLLGTPKSRAWNISLLISAILQADDRSICNYYFACFCQLYLNIEGIFIIKMLESFFLFCWFRVTAEVL